MKIAKIILFGLLAVILLASGLIVYCFFNPEVAGEIGNKLYKNEAEEIPDGNEENYTPPEGDGNYVPYEPNGNSGEVGNLEQGDVENQEEENSGGTDNPEGTGSSEGTENPKDSDNGQTGDNGGNIESTGENGGQEYPNSQTPDYDITPAAGYPYSSQPYVAPDENQLNVPGELQKKSGLEFPKYSKEEIEDPEADEIEDSLGPGETGEGLTFSALYYPYYHMLDDTGKSLYRQIYANANALNKKFSPVTQCNSKDVSKAMTAVFCDHPELFWLNTAYNLRCRRNGKVAEIDLSFNQLANDLTKAKNEFENAANSIINGAKSLGSDFEKEKYVHDALADKNDYSLSAPLNQSAYSALVNGKTVCAGYARGMQYLLTKLGIPCYYCMGYAGENHAWNIVKLDNDFYNVDATWDDADPTNYDYFNKSDDYYAKDHARRDLSVNLPACKGSGYQVDNPQDQNESDKPQEQNGADSSQDQKGSDDSIVFDNNSNGPIVIEFVLQ